MRGGVCWQVGPGPGRWDWAVEGAVEVDSACSLGPTAVSASAEDPSVCRQTAGLKPTCDTHRRAATGKLLGFSVCPFARWQSGKNRTHLLATLLAETLVTTCETPPAPPRPGPCMAPTASAPAAVWCYSRTSRSCLVVPWLPSSAP